MKKIVITGGLGHMGSSILKDQRLKEFDKVIVLDNFISQRHCSLFGNMGTDKIEIVEADIRYDDMTSIMRGAHTVLHLAATVNAAETIDSDGSTRLNNYIGTTRVLDTISRVGIDTFINMSTTSVYGPSKVERTELTENFYPQSPYAEYKLEAEKYLINSKNIKKKFTLRPGTLFGFSQGMRFHTVTNKFVWMAANGLPLTIWKPGTGKRPYVSLTDIKNAIFNIINRQITPGTYNVVTKHWNPNEIVEFIKKYAEVNIAYVQPRILNQDSYIINTDKAIKEKLYNNLDPADAQLDDYIKYMFNEVFTWSNNKKG